MFRRKRNLKFDVVAHFLRKVENANVFPVYVVFF